MAIAIGPIVGGLLLDHFWWGSVFLINVPLTAVGRGRDRRCSSPSPRTRRPGRIDYLGVLLSIVGLVLVVYGIIQGGDTGLLAARRRARPGRSAGWRSSPSSPGTRRRIAHPSLDVRLFRDPRLSSATGARSRWSSSRMSGAFFFITFYPQNVRGYSAAAGRAADASRSRPASCWPRRAAPRLVRRFGAQGGRGDRRCCWSPPRLAGYQLLGTGTPIWVLEVTFFVQGAGMGMVMPPATEAVMSVVPRDRGGAGSALTNISRQVAVALGVAVLGSVLAQAYRGQLAPHLTALPPAARNQATAVDRGHPAGRRAPGPGAAATCWPRRPDRSCTPCTSPR